MPPDPGIHLGRKRQEPLSSPNPSRSKRIKMNKEASFEFLIPRSSPSQPSPSPDIQSQQNEDDEDDPIEISSSHMDDSSSALGEPSSTSHSFDSEYYDGLSLQDLTPPSIKMYFDTLLEEEKEGEDDI
ncbi:MAG: hypothetical protein J3R72DRAFT_520928 [Linnemannia gamsii]|nr:MAG: hypothetical protein J3R72DRAFT_520928 [Linnemannia gamsii]